MFDLQGRQLGKYTLEEPLGFGGMASVYLALDNDLQRRVAIKVMDPALVDEPGSVERFRREAVTAANLEHPNIMPVYDVAEAEGLHYIAMRYVPGETLRDLLAREERLSLDSAIAILKPVAAALDYAHERGVIHRDIKPGNIMIEPSGHVVLTDFGIARAGAQDRLTRTGKVMGTAEYLAPEQITGKEVTTAADRYSLGIVLYETLTGRTPFSGDHLAETLYKAANEPPPPLRSIRPDLPPALENVMSKALEKNPALRFPTATAFISALEPIAADAVATMARRTAFAGAPTAAQLIPPPSPGFPQLKQQARVATPNSGLSGIPQLAGIDRRILIGVGALVALVALLGLFAITRPRLGSVASATATPQTAQAGSGTAQAGSNTVLAEETGVAVIQTPSVAANAEPTQPPGEQTAFSAPRAPAYNGPRRDGNAPDFYMGRANKPPVIDGDISDWSGTQAFTPIKVITNPEGWKGPDDLSAEFRIGYDDSNFYFSAVITDNVHVQNRLTRRYDLWKGDDVELWFDFDLAGDFNLDPGDGDDWQWGLSPGDFSGWPPQSVFFRPEQLGGSEKGVAVAARPRGEAGYSLEASLPWPLAGWKPNPDGGAIGFCASVGDNDAVGTAQQQKMSSTCQRMKWNVPTTYGMLFY